MIGIVRKYRLEFLLYALLLCLGGVLVLAVPRTELHLLMNSSHTAFQDFFFKTITWIGDGWFAVFFSVLFLAIRFRYFFMLILSYSISGLLAQLLKRFIWPGALRPAALLEQMPDLQTVPGVHLHHYFSFPSGHTTTAFAVLLLAGFILKRRSALFLAIILAWFVAFSRVYLSQHFLIDTLAGSLLGTLSALFFYWYFQRLKPEWLDRSVLNIFAGGKK